MNIYQQRQDVGSIFIRSSRNVVTSATLSMSGVYDVFETRGINASSWTNVRDFDIWYDTMLIYTPDNIMFARISFDYDTEAITTTSDDIYVIPLQSNVLYGGTWLFEEVKKVTLCTLLSCGNYIYPRLYQLDLDTFTLGAIFDSNTGTNIASALGITSLEEPVMSYNPVTKQYYIASICKSSTFPNSFGILQYLIQDNGSTHSLKTYNVITPVTI